MSGDKTPGHKQPTKIIEKKKGEDGRGKVNLCGRCDNPTKTGQKPGSYIGSQQWVPQEEEKKSEGVLQRMETMI